MKRSLLLLLCTLGLALPLQSVAETADYIHVHTLAEATAEAKTSGRLIIIDYAMDS